MAKEYMRCQRYKEAQIMEEAVMEYRQDRLTLSSAEKWEEAKELQIQLVGILEEKGGESEAMLKGIENNLALTYASLGLLDEAEHIIETLLWE
ncbi:MAG: hypothetical protein Q9204_005990, partial [Flavoplaca sp. TL-2023a]